MLVALLIAALSVLAMAGVLHVIRGTPVEHVVAPGDPDGPPHAREPAFVRTVELLVGARLEPGNRVALLENGDGSYPPLWRDIERAGRSVTVQMYYAKPGRVADALADRLAERAAAGVPVLLLLDAFGGWPLLKRRAWSDRLRAAGVQVARLRPLRPGSLHTVGNRSHVRAVVVDGQVGYTGGFGIADYWLGGGQRPGEWRDTSVRVEGPAALQLQAAFAIAWGEAVGDLLTGTTYFPDVGAATGPATGAADAGVRASFLFTTPSSGSTSAERFLALSIAGARERLYVTNSYFTPDDDLRRLLLAAAARGVDVRVMTAGQTSDVKTTLYAGRSRYQRLLDGGVRIYEYQPTMMHAKTLVADGCWCSVGAMNFDNRSLAHNDEATLVAWDAGIAGAVEAMFLRDLDGGEEVVAERWRRRGAATRVLEQGARAMARLL